MTSTRVPILKIVLSVGVGLVVLLVSIFGALNYMKTAPPDSAASIQKSDHSVKPATEPSVHSKTEPEPIASGFAQRFAGTALHPLALKMQSHPRVSLAVLFGVVAVLVAVVTTLAIILSQSPAQDVEDAPVIKTVEDEILKDEPPAVADPIWKAGWFIPVLIVVLIIFAIFIILAIFGKDLAIRFYFWMRMPKKGAKKNLEAFFSQILDEDSKKKLAKVQSKIFMLEEDDETTTVYNITNEQIDAKYAEDEKDQLTNLISAIIENMPPYLCYRFLMEMLGHFRSDATNKPVSNELAEVLKIDNNISYSSLHNMYTTRNLQGPFNREFHDPAPKIFAEAFKSMGPYSPTELCEILCFWYYDFEKSMKNERNANQAILSVVFHDVKLDREALDDALKKYNEQETMVAALRSCELDKLIPAIARCFKHQLFLRFK